MGNQRQKGAEMGCKPNPCSSGERDFLNEIAELRVAYARGNRGSAIRSKLALAYESLAEPLLAERMQEGDVPLAQDEALRHFLIQNREVARPLLLSSLSALSSVLKAARSQLKDPPALRIESYVLGQELKARPPWRIYEGTDEAHDQPVRICLRYKKTFNSAWLRAFLETAYRGAAFRHPLALGVKSVGQSEWGEAYFVLDAPRGESLETLLQRGHVFTKQSIARIGESLLMVLQQAHSQGFLHQFLQAGCLYVSDQRAQLFGVGLAAIFDETGDRRGFYRSPEFSAGARGDLYAAALLLYELLGGVNSTAGFKPVEPAHFWSVLERALSVDPKARYPHAGAFLEAWRSASARLGEKRLVLPPLKPSPALKPQKHVSTDPPSVGSDAISDGFLSGEMPAVSSRDFLALKEKIEEKSLLVPQVWEPPPPYGNVQNSGLRQPEPVFSQPVLSQKEWTPPPSVSSELLSSQEWLWSVRVPESHLIRINNEQNEAYQSIVQIEEKRLGAAVAMSNRDWNALKRLDLFKDLTEEEWRTTKPCLDCRQLEQAGMVIFDAGELQTAAYVVGSGLVALGAVDEQGQWQVLQQLSKGSVFGERALTFAGNHALRAVTLQSTRLYRIDRTAFECILCEKTALASKLQRGLGQILCDHLRKLNQQFKPSEGLGSQHAFSKWSRLLGRGK